MGEAIDIEAVREVQIGDIVTVTHALTGTGQGIDVMLILTARAGEIAREIEEGREIGM